MKRFVEMLGGLGQPARLEIFRMLVRAGLQGLCVDEIRQRLQVPGSTLSHHLDTLASCGLLSARRQGRFIHYAVDWQHTAELIRFLTEDCCADLHERFAPCGPAPGQVSQRTERPGAAAARATKANARSARPPRRSPRPEGRP